MKRWWSKNSFVTVMLLLAGLFGKLLSAQEWYIETVAGNGSAELGPNEGPATEVAISQPFGVEFGPDGRLFVTEVGHHRVWAVSLDRNHAVVVAGTGRRGYAGDDGPAQAARLNEPYEVRFTTQGVMYFVEMQNHVVRSVDRQGTIRTIAGTGVAGFAGDGGPARHAQFRQPHSIALDPSGQFLFVADIGNHRIRRIDLTTGTIQTIAGNGDRQLPEDGKPAKERPVLGPRALYVTEGNLWVALREGHSVWRLDLSQTTWHLVAGTGRSGFDQNAVATSKATFFGPKGLAMDRRGYIYIADTENHAIRMIDPTVGKVETIAGRGPKEGGYGGDGGPARLALLNRPHGICVGPDGAVYVGDTLNHRARRIYRK